MPRHRRLAPLTMAGTLALSASTYLLTRPLDVPLVELSQPATSVSEKHGERRVENPSITEDWRRAISSPGALASPASRSSGVQSTVAANSPLPNLALTFSPLPLAENRDLPQEGQTGPQRSNHLPRHGRSGGAGRHLPNEEAAHPSRKSFALEKDSSATAINKPQLPIVLQDLSGASLTPGQVNAVNHLQDDFIQQVGGERQNPHDPLYLERWKTAERSAYEKLRAQIGDVAANQLSIISAQNAYRSANSAR